MSRTRIGLPLLATILLVASASAPGAAQDYPTRHRKDRGAQPRGLGHRHIGPRSCRSAEPEMGDVGGGGKCLRRRLGQCRGGRGRACGAGWLHADAVPARTDLDQWPDVQEHGLRSGEVGRDQSPHDGPVRSRAAQKFPGVDRRGIHRSREGEAQDDHRGIGRPRIERHARCRQSRTDGRHSTRDRALSRPRAGDEGCRRRDRSI